MKLLITGGTGFVGSVLLDLLPEAVEYSQITVLSLPGDPNRRNILSKGIHDLTVIEGDVNAGSDIEEAVRGHTHVIHLAGLISYWKKDRLKLFQVNQRGVENMVHACLKNNVTRMIHVSSVGAVGFYKDGSQADEGTVFNWPRGFYYMESKRAGQLAVEKAVRENGLNALVLNPASVMGPGDPDPHSPHNQLFTTIFEKTLFGCFSGGLAVVDVRDLARIIIKALHMGSIGERYLIVGSNVSYTEVVKAIGRCFRRRVYPFRVPSLLIAAAGEAMEIMSGITNKKPILTYSYGRLSGWYGYYSNRKSREAFRHEYIPFEKTIADACEYYRKTRCEAAPFRRRASCRMSESIIPDEQTAT